MFLSLNLFPNLFQPISSRRIVTVPKKTNWASKFARGYRLGRGLYGVARGLKKSFDAYSNFKRGRIYNAYYDMASALYGDYRDDFLREYDNNYEPELFGVC